MFNKSDQQRLISHLLVLTLLYSICRILFYLFNLSYFSDIASIELLRLLSIGLKFDLSAIIIINFPFIVLYLWPFAVRESHLYRLLLQYLFIIINGSALFINCIDLANFQLTNARLDTNSSAIILNNVGYFLTIYIKNYWHVFVFGATLTFSLYNLYNKIEIRKYKAWRLREYFSQFLWFIVYIPILFFLQKGTISKKSINVDTAESYTSIKNAPLIVNTPFTIFKTRGSQEIIPSKLWQIKNENHLKTLYNPTFSPDTAAFQPLNICVIILEGFSKEYIGALNGKHKGYTPFLDLVIRQSLVFDNAYANGLSAVDGTPAVLAGIPTWMKGHYVFSPYATNNITSIANQLKVKGYRSSFFYGKSNSISALYSFLKKAGYSEYYGRDEYNNEKHFDGYRGIWDEEFLQYSANKINSLKQPFVASIITLSTSPPYYIPEKYQKVFKKGEYPLQNAIAYCDYSLRKFFETTHKMPWYKNTLFVITANPANVSHDTFYNNSIGLYKIPILFFKPGGELKERNNRIVQQIDIMPSVLDYLNYPSSCFAFGKNVFTKMPRKDDVAVTYHGGIYQIINKDYVLSFDGDKPLSLYHYTNDQTLSKNIISEEPVIAKHLEIKLKSIVQTYQQHLLNHKTP